METKVTKGRNQECLPHPHHHLSAVGPAGGGKSWGEGTQTREPTPGSSCPEAATAEGRFLLRLWIPGGDRLHASGEVQDAVQALGAGASCRKNQDSDMPRKPQPQHDSGGKARAPSPGRPQKCSHRGLEEPGAPTNSLARPWAGAQGGQEGLKARRCADLFTTLIPPAWAESPPPTVCTLLGMLAG